MSARVAVSYESSASESDLESNTDENGDKSVSIDSIDSQPTDIKTEPPDPTDEVNDEGEENDDGTDNEIEEVKEEIETSSDDDVGLGGVDGDLGGESGSESDNEELLPGQGLANVMAHILKKEVPINKATILVKGQTDREIIAKKRKREEEEEVKETGEEKKIELNQWQKQEKKHKWEELGRYKPIVLQRDTERQLQRIATKGVVQLFNAVRKQQRIIDDRMKEAGPSERRKEKVMKGISKGAFLDVLKGSAANVTAEPTVTATKASKEKKASKVKTEREEDNPTWSVLRDNFMMGAKMKDWDKNSGSDGEDGESDDGDGEMESESDS